jgi:hypothetical protein
MEKFGLQGLVINSDTIREARKRGEDLWKTAETGPSLLFMAPEQLISKGFDDLAKDDGEFAARLCAIAVDEAHLLNTWGRSWRKAFQQIGFVRARFSRVVLIALTATMRAGQPTESVCESLGLHRGQFHFLRRSNARPDVQILFRTMMSGMGGKKFPELDWVLRGKRKTLIFCRTIHLGYRIKKYLCKQSDNLDADKYIRLYNALNWPELNAETRKMMEEDAYCQITIGTDTMSVGVDLSCVEDVIVIGEPEDVDDLFQKFGRVGRNKELVTNARAILYLGQGAVESAHRIVEASAGNGTIKKTDTMDISVAKMVVASCKVDEQNHQYDNPVDETPCTCHSCQEHPPRPRARPCNCSGCMPENLPVQEPAQHAVVNPGSDIPRSKRLTKPMRTIGASKLAEFRLQLWNNADEKQFGMLPPPIFFPDADIKQVLNRFSLLTTTEELANLLRHNNYLLNDFDSLFVVVCDLQKEFDVIRLANKEKARVGRLAKKAAKKAEKDFVNSGTEGELTEVTDETGDDSDGDRPSHGGGPSGIKLRINLRSLTAVRVDNGPAESSNHRDLEDKRPPENSPLIMSVSDA